MSPLQNTGFQSILRIHFSDHFFKSYKNDSLTRILGITHISLGSWPISSNYCLLNISRRHFESSSINVDGQRLMP
jgi:hypothetical protein